MDFVRIPNPIPLEERAGFYRLLAHDFVSRYNDLLKLAKQRTRFYEKEGERKRQAGISAIYDHHWNILQALPTLCDEDYSYLEVIKESDLRELLEAHTAYFDYLHHYEPGRFKTGISTSMEFDRSFFGDNHILYTALHNLLKNSVIEAVDEGSVNLSVSSSEGRVEKPIYKSSLFRNGNQFVVFAVRDNGPGFDTSRPLESYLEDGITTHGYGTGFGLHYATLVCDYLQGCMTINPEPGNTEVALYVPFATPEMDLTGKDSPLTLLEQHRKSID